MSMERFIIEIVRREIALPAMGRVVKTEDDYRASAKRFQNDTPFTKTRQIQPYGLASRPPEGMESLLISIGGEPTHMVLVGQNDAGRPPIKETESALYGPDGQVIYMKAGGSIHQGSMDASSPAVLGDVLAEFLEAFLKAMLESPSIGESPVGPVMLSPAIRQKFTEMLQKYITAEGSNILAKKIFVDRGEV